MMISSVAEKPDTERIPTLFQYTVEAYKSFQKLAEILPNPLSAQTFANFARDERSNRDLLDVKYSSSEKPGMQITLAGDLRFQDMLEGDLSNREILETLIVRERTMDRKLAEWAAAAGNGDRNLFNYIAGTKRAHLAVLERELAMTRIYDDWLRREDALSIVIHGKPAE